MCGRCRPPALWAGEHPNARLSSSRDPAPAADGAALAMASRMTTAPHPRLGCTSGPDGGPCAACRDAPEREAGESSVARPIGKGEGVLRMVERCMAFNDKEKMARALMTSGQTGVAVPGGLQMGVYMLEVMLRLDRTKGLLNIDRRNEGAWRTDYPEADGF